MRAAFQGIHGAFSEVAARSMLGSTVTTIPCESFEEVFDAVERGRAHRGIIPIENSLTGSIHQNYDLLLHRHVHIVGERHLRIEHVLGAHPRSNFTRLRRVRSHPQALAQCGKFLRRHPALLVEPFFDTAGAARSIIDSGDPDTAAISGAYAARLYGLRILRRNLEDRVTNFTRFLLVGPTPRAPRRGGKTKCSIVFRPQRNQPGILFRILGVFSLRDIDLVKIESRPDPEAAFDYLFYLDFLGDPAEERVARALEHLQEVVVTYRLLGAYPADRRDQRTTLSVRSTWARTGKN
jgi:prephenate dehydratase